MKGAAAVTALALAAVGLLAYILTQSAELPEPNRGDQREVFPDLDYGAAVPGSRIDRIYQSFGKALSESGKAATVNRCIYFLYDRELYDGALVVLTNGALVQNRWVVKGSTKPEGCSGFAEERVDLRGWYAAAAR